MSETLRYCKTCEVEKDVSMFSGGRTTCKVCRVAQQRQRRLDDPERYKALRNAYREENKDKVNAAAREWRAQHPENVKQWRTKHYAANKSAINAATMAYYEANKESQKIAKRMHYRAKRDYYLEKASQYYSLNKSLYRAHGAKRRAAQKAATPTWANISAIAIVYAKAERLRKWLEADFHVDHIVPLISKYVCGLHCEANLQILPAEDNLAKSNNWWPDMPDPIHENKGMTWTHN